MSLISFSPNTRIKSADVNTNFTGLSDGTLWTTSAVKLGYVQTTSPFSTASTTAVQVTGLTLTVTVPTGGRSVKITAHCPDVYSSGSGDFCSMSIWDGTVGSGTQLQEASFKSAAASQDSALTAMIVVTPSAGSKTYNVGFRAQVGGTANFGVGATTPGFLLAENL